MSFDFIFCRLGKMLDFIYDSLDTVKKLKFPTVKQFVQLTTAIFGLVIVAGIYFIICDTIFSEGYKMFYSSMTSGEEIVLDDAEASAEDAAAEGTQLEVVPAVDETAVEETTISETAEDIAAEPAGELVE